MNRRERRWKIARIDYTTMLDFLQHKDYVITNLPKDFEVMTVHSNPQYNCFDIFIESEEFKKVEIGAMCPEFQLVIEKQNGENNENILS